MEKWGPSTIRYVTPHKGLRLALRLDGAKVKAVHSLIGTQVRHEEESGESVENATIILELPLLDLYDSIVVEYV